MEKAKPVLLSREGLEQLNEAIKELEQKIDAVAKERTNDSDGKIDDSICCISTTCQEEHRRLVHDLKQMHEDQVNAVLVEKEEPNPTKAQMGDYLKLDVPRVGKPATYILLLSGKYFKDNSTVYRSASLNSPIGKGLRGELIGSTINIHLGSDVEKTPVTIMGKVDPKEIEELAKAR